MLNNKGRVTDQREVRSVWNNAQRVNHQNKLTHPHPKRNFVPTAVATKSGQVSVNAAKQNSPRAASSISTARPVNTAAPKPKVKDALPTTYSYFKSHSPGNPQYTLQDQGIFDSGCSSHNYWITVLLTDNKKNEGGTLLHLEEVLKGVLTKDVVPQELYCGMKGIKREFSVAGTPQQNKVAERKNRTLIEASKTMLADSLLPITFWAEAVNTACYVHNRLPSKLFENDHTCVACQKGKQHKASCKTKLVSSISQPLQMLHMDLFGPTSVRSINHKTYCLVVTDDFSRFSWVFFLATKDETSGILKTFITGIENQINHKVKIIRCDNGTEFKNNDMNQFCGMKGIKREFSVARTPQQNRVAERKNRTLIEAARTMLADSLLPTTF
ncbi:putative ribonuclease H-like domain-containing protein [Tanacetum coccineum]